VPAADATHQKMDNQRLKMDNQRLLFPGEKK
jgi:hypothetical protein